MGVIATVNDPLTSDTIAWPEFPDLPSEDAKADFQRILYEAKVAATLDEWRGQVSAQAAKEQAAQPPNKWDLAFDPDVMRSLYSGYIEVAKNIGDRWITRAQTVEKSAASIAAVYGALLGLVYSVQDGVELPIRGLWAAVFLGLAIAFATTYLAWAATPAAAKLPDLFLEQRLWLQAFISWAVTPTYPRREFLRAAVASLTLGVGFFPAAFLDVSHATVMIAALVGMLGVVSLLIWPRISARISVTMSVFLRMFRVMFDAGRCVCLEPLFRSPSNAQR